MTALSADRITKHRSNSGGPTIMEFPCAVDILYEGGIVAINTSGYAAPASDTSGVFVVGIADEHVDNSGGSAGDKTIRVRSGEEYNLAATGTVAQASVGDIFFAADDQTVDDTTTNSVRVGYVSEYVSATNVWVFIPPGGMAINPS